MGDVEPADPDATALLTPVGDRPQGDVRTQALGAVRWSALARSVVQLCTFGGTVVFAQLLSPRDFGLAAIVLVISNFALLLSDLGLGSAIVHTADLDQRFLDTAFWLNALLGLVLTGVVAALSFPLAVLFHHRPLTGLFLLSSLTYALALTVVPLSIMERRLQLKPAAISEILGAVLSLAVGLILALAGTGAVALVAIPIVNVAILSIAYSYFARYRPHGFIDRRAAAAIWSYSRGLTGFNIVNYFTRNADDLLLGKFASTASLGFYNRAFAVMLLPVQQVQLIIGRVLFPALRTIHGDTAKLIDAHRRSLLASSALCAPVAVLVASCSHDFVLSIFGSRWAPMIPMVAILSSTGVQQVLQGTAGTLYQVTGRTDLMFKWNILFTALTLISFGIGVYWGAIGVCVAVAVRGWALYPLTVSVPLKLIGDRFLAVQRLLMPLLACLVLEAAAALGTFLLLRHSVDQPFVRLAIEVLAGGLVYLIALAALDRKTLTEVLSMAGRTPRPGGRHHASL